MPEDRDILGRFEQVDIAIARDIERRRRSRRVYWLLLAATALVALLSVFYGEPQADKVAMYLAKAPDFHEAVASAVARDPDMEKSVQKTAEQATLEAAKAPEFAKELSSNPVFLDRMRQSATEAVGAYTAEPVFRALVENVAASSPTHEDVVGRLAAADAQLARDRDEMAKLATEQVRFAKLLERPRVPAPDYKGNLEALSKQLAEVSAKLDAQQAELKLLAKWSVAASTTFLLKENEVAPLPGLDLSITLGKRVGDGIEGVKILGASGQLFPTTSSGAAANNDAAKVRFGEPFEFDDRAGNRFRATLPNSQSRFLARDFVVLHIVRLLPKEQ